MAGLVRETEAGLPLYPPTWRDQTACPLCRSILCR